MESQKHWYGKIVQTRQRRDLEGRPMFENKQYIVTFLLGDGVVGLAPYDEPSDRIYLDTCSYNRELFTEDLTEVGGLRYD